ncbi:uncharacterized protein N7458_004854 [Penicillium daleae]|uniref:Ankyrin repeat domain-containing protein n=1 Tax=Penicillium daleae TaxID=63821 RepID=A0AAD6C7T0_9EURO|nr:uncharacterized protein N7458_004854 [Penicillium daleae]KAJ5453898.1 hypothetical protein N7458_004854 [Penicillium daleae]
MFRDMLDSLASNDKFEIHDLDTIMMDAIRNNDTQFTLELLSQGLSLLPDYALEATKWKAKNVLELFFEKGWDINKAISEAQPPLLSGSDTQQGQLLFHALERKSEIIEVLQLLLKEGASLNATMYQNHYPSWALYFFMGLGIVLHKAAELGNVQVVSFLVSEGIGLSIKDANGLTALDCARNLDKVEVVKILEDSLSH